MAFIFGILAAVFTFLGGLFALRFKDKLHLILGFSAGAVVAVAFFDLMPEALTLGSADYSFSLITTIIAIGFVVFMILDRALSIHAHHDEDNCQNKEHSGFHGAATLALHSFLDGLAIGLAFKASSAVGAIVAAAVLAHDFSDGINTVNYILKNPSRDGSRAEASSKVAFRWLTIDAIAPLLGVGATYFITISDNVLGLILALFCGFFLYIGASDLLPESHHQHPKTITTIMTVLGMAVLYLAIYLAKI